MKLDHLLEQIQASAVQTKQEVTDENEQTIEKPGNSLAHINAETTARGLMAIGGCRKCAKTFVDRLELIHHFVDHFPTIFYSFESLTSTVHETTFLEQFAQFLTNIKAHPANVEKSVLSSSEKPQEDSNQLDTSNSKSDSLSYHMCSYCCQTFNEIVSFENHLKTHTSNVFSSPIFQCEQCQMKFNNLYSLEEHRRLHVKLCHICGEQFDTVFDLNVHIGIHCGNPYACKDCGEAFRSRKELAQHNRIHRMIIDSDMQTEANSTSSNNKKVHKQLEPEKEDKPESLLSSNLYFNGLSKHIIRRRRVRILRKSTKN